MPGTSTNMRYWPGVSTGNTYNPTSFVLLLATTLVAALVSVTPAFGTTASLWSRTVPRTLPVLDCENARGTSEINRQAAMQRPNDATRKFVFILNSLRRQE